MTTLTSTDELREQVLTSADALFCSRGVQAVGMDDVRTASGLSLKRLYQLFPGKESLLVACLAHRDATWWTALGGYVDSIDDPRDKVVAVYDWLELQFVNPKFRGCPWINTYGELSAVAPNIAHLVRDHKYGFRTYLNNLIEDAGLPDTLTDPLLMLAEGCMVIAGLFDEPGSGATAKRAAIQLINAATIAQPAAKQTKTTRQPN